MLTKILKVFKEGYKSLSQKTESSLVVYDYDGNKYNTITIGNQIWMTENLKTTHYKDGTPIIYMPYADYENLGSSWINGAYGNYYFSTFDTSGTTILSAIANPGSYGFAKLNETLNLNIGDYIFYVVDLSLNSGDNPYVILFKDNMAYSAVSLNNGINIGGFIINLLASYTLGIGTMTTNGTNFSATFIMSDNYDKGWINVNYGCYCWYNNDINYKTPYGALYNWYAVNDSHGLAPEGWRVATLSDFEELYNYLGVSAGAFLKKTGYENWNYPNLGALNTTKFSAIGNGERNIDGNFLGIRDYSTLWTQTEKNYSESYYSMLYTINTDFYYNAYNNKKCGFGVRCLKNI